jgi:talin
VKTVLIDDSFTVSEIVDHVGKKMGINNPEEFSLMFADKWCKAGQALHEQGISDAETLVLKKKFFFNDANIDRSDPVQLHLLFSQCKDAIVQGTYPTQRNEAKDLAALQLQIEQQDFNAARHKPGAVKLNECLPPEHLKDGTMERDVFAEWRKLVGMTEVNAKFRYVQLCRSLKTYGITSFLVKHKDKKKKMISLLIGVTRDSILKMDAETNEVLQTYPLTHLRRWAASGKTFTLDFGDYEDDYFIVETDEGENISQLIAGYIDIILKARSDATTIVEDDDSNVADVTTVAPIRAMATRVQTSSTTKGGVGGKAVPGQSGGPGQAVSISGAGGAQSIVITDLKSAMRANKMLSDELGRPGDFTTTNSLMSPQQLKEQVNAHGNAIQTSADELLQQGLVDPNDLNKAAMLNAAKKLMGAVMQMGASAKMAAASGKEVDENLLNSAKAVSDAIQRLLNASDQLMQNPHNPGFRDAMQASRDDVLHAGHYLNAAVKGEMTDVASQELLLACSRALAAAVADMVTSTQDSAKTLKDGQQMKSLLNASKSLKKDGEAAANAATALAPAVVSSDARRVVDQLGQSLDQELNRLLAEAKRTGLSQGQLDNLLASAKDVSDAIAALMAAANNAQQNSKFVDADEFDSANNMLVASLAKMKSDMADRKNVVDQTKTIALSSNKLIAASKAVSQAQDNATAQRLLAASKACAEAVTELVNQAKSTAANASDANQRALRVACDTLQQRAQVLHSDAGKIAQYEALRRDAKFSAAASTVMVANAKANAATMEDRAAADALLNAALGTASAISKLLDSVGKAQHHSSSDAAQQELLQTAKLSLLPTTQTITECKRAAPKINDMAKKQALNQAAEGAARGAQKLAGSIKSAAALSTTAEVDDALEQFAATSADLDATEFAAQAGLLQRPAGVTNADAAQVLAHQASEFTRAQREMVGTSRTAPAKLGGAAKQMSDATQELVNAVKNVVATTASRDEQKDTIAKAKAVIADTHDLVSAARSVAGSPNDPQLGGMLDTSDGRVTESLKALVGSTSGVDTEAVTKAIEACSQAPSRLKPTKTGVTFPVAAEELTASVRILQAATAQAVTCARTNPKGLSQAAKITASSMPNFVKTANVAMGVAPDAGVRDAVMNDTRQVIDMVQKVLEDARTRVGTNSPAADRALGEAGDAMQESVKALLKTLGTGGNPACDEAITKIMNAIDMMEAGKSHPDAEPARTVQAGAKSLAQSTQGLVASSKEGADAIGNAATHAAATVARMCNATAVLANPDGTSESNFPSEEPNPAVAEPVAVIKEASQALRQHGGSTPQIVGSARTIAQTTAQLVQVAKREAASATDKQVAAKMLKAAQALATATSNTARCAKASAQKQAGADEQLAGACDELDQSLDALLDASRPPARHHGAATLRGGAGAGSAPQLDPNDAARLQTAMHEAATATTTLIGACGNVAAKPTDKQLQTAMGSSANAVVNAIRKLLDAASALSPGVKECERAREATQLAINDLGSASLAVAVGNLDVRPPAGTSHQQHQQAIVRAAQSLQGATSSLADPKSSVEIAAAAKTIGSVVPELAQAAQYAAGTTKDARAQDRIINLSKDLAEAESELLTTSALVAGDPKNQQHRDKAAAVAQRATQSIQSLMSILQAEVELLHNLDDAIAAIRAALPQIDTPAPAGVKYGEAKVEIGRAARSIGSSARALVACDKKNITLMGNSSGVIAAAVPELISAAKAAAASTEDRTVQTEVLEQTRKLGRACEALAVSAKACAVDAGDARALSTLTGATKAATEAIQLLLNAAKRGDVASFAADETVAQVTRNIGQLDAAALYAASGQLERDPNGDPSFVKAQQKLAQAGQATRQGGAKTLQAGAKGTPTQLRDAMHAVANNADAIVEHAKAAASLIDNLDTQQALLQSAKAVMLALSTLINASRDQQQSPNDRAVAQAAAEADKTLADSIDALTSTAAAAAEEQSRGARDLDEASAAIERSLKGFDAHGNPAASAEDLVVSCRGVAGSTAALMSAANMSDPAAMSTAAKQITDAAVSLLENGKGAQRLTDKQIVKAALDNSSKASAKSILDMLAAARALTSAKITPESQQKLSNATQTVANNIHAVVEAARQLPGAEHLRLEEEGDDLEDLAEQELLKAAEEIRRATQRLQDQIKPRAAKLAGINEIDIVGPIIDAASAITMACGTLVQAAHQAQKERVDQKREGKSMYRKDPMWSNGLISAAQNVVGSVKQLVENANEVAQGEGGEEHLIAASKMVAAATAQLVSASRAKAADPFSSTQQQLMKAAKLVADATTQLVAVAREAWDRKAEEDEALVGLSNAAQRKAEFDQRVEIERLQAALERAQSKQRKMRADVYTDDNAAPAAAAPRAAAAAPAGGAGRGGVAARGGPAPAGGAARGGLAPARGGAAPMRGGAAPGRLPGRN